MQKTINRIAWILICIAAAASPALAESTDLTVGEFLHRVAQTRHLDAVTGADAVRQLRSSGVALPDYDLDEPITEGMVVAVSRSLGIRVTTSRPDAPFDGRSLPVYLELVAQQSATPGSSAASGDEGPYPRPDEPAADPRTKGKGKKKGLPPVSGSDPV